MVNTSLIIRLFVDAAELFAPEFSLAAWPCGRGCGGVSQLSHSYWHPGAASALCCRDLAMAPFFGNSVACRIAEAHEIKHSTLVLGDWRAAQRIEFCIGQCEEDVEGAARQQDGTSGGAASTVGGDATGGQRSVVSGPGGFKVWVVNTHLDHEHTDKRQRQVRAF